MGILFDMSHYTAQVPGLPSGLEYREIGSSSELNFSVRQACVMSAFPGKNICLMISS